MSIANSLTVGIALSLYAYNVSPVDRATALFQHFNGNCMELDDMVELFVRRGAYAMTKLPFPTAVIYLQQALEKYGAEARNRVTSQLLI